MRRRLYWLGCALAIVLAFSLGGSLLLGFDGTEWGIAVFLFGLAAGWTAAETERRTRDGLS